jgi:hypothetical protein
MLVEAGRGACLGGWWTACTLDGVVLVAPATGW